MVGIVLVHGGFVDGSGWEAVYQILRKAGHAVTVVQNPTLSLADDAAVTKRALDQQADQAVLVGHSYGGAVITEAGTHPKVAALVYIAAFAPDRGESVNTLIADPPPGAPVPPILPPQDGFLFLDRAKFAASFAADVNPDLAAFMADSQVPWGVDALAGAITEPAWRTKPSWYLVATEDRMIPPDAQRFMSQRANAKVVETAASHAVYVSQPAAVAALIETAVRRSAARNTITPVHGSAGHHRTPRWWPRPTDAELRIAGSLTSQRRPSRCCSQDCSDWSRSACMLATSATTGSPAKTRSSSHEHRSDCRPRSIDGYR